LGAAGTCLAAAAEVLTKFLNFPNSHDFAGFCRKRPTQRLSCSMQKKSFFFEKKKQKTFDCFGFGLSGRAQPKVAKVFWFFFSKKNRFSRPCLSRHDALHPCANVIALAGSLPLDSYCAGNPGSVPPWKS
jgi:hypothetical protein